MTIIYDVTNCKNHNGSWVNQEAFCTEEQLEEVEGIPNITSTDHHWGLLKIVDGVIYTNMFAEGFSDFEIDLVRDMFDKEKHQKHKMWFAHPKVRTKALEYLRDVYY